MSEISSEEMQELIRLRKAIALFRGMPVKSAASEKEPYVKIDLINFTKALEVADGTTDPSEWINEPCKNVTGKGSEGIPFGHTPHHWSELTDTNAGIRISHWCNGEL